MSWVPARPRRDGVAKTEGEMALTDPATLSPVRLDDLSSRSALALSAAVICLNEAACIGKCLESLRDCAEIVVLDSGSTDATAAIVDDFVRRGFPIRFIRQPWLGYARQKQLALDLTTQPWVLSVDADEWVDEDLRASLPRLMSGGRVGRRLESAPFAHALRAGEAVSAVGLGLSTSCGSCGGAGRASIPR